MWRHLLCRTLTVFLTIVTTHVFAEINQSDLQAVTTAVREMCLHPDRRGEYIQIKGELGADVVLKISDLNILGTINIERWEGISQRLDDYRTDPRSCAQAILPLILTYFVPIAESTNTAYQYFHAFSMILVRNPDGSMVVGGDLGRRNFYFGVLQDMSSRVNNVAIRNLLINELENRTFGTALLEEMCNEYRGEILRNASTAGSNVDERQTFNVVFDNARDICTANYWGQ